MSLSPDPVEAALAAVETALEGAAPAAIAVSGGVDSMTLATIAQRRLGPRAAMFHAVSPAVPPHATARVEDHARRQGWALTVLGAGEFDDPDYLKNPVNRCYFCKSNLYARLRDGAGAGAVLCSGANLDDLGDFRPGLAAAAERGVRHPLVEAGVDKAMVRALAARLGLDDLAELPAQPCLSSRVETGLAIEAADLALIDRVEQGLRADLAAAGITGDIRCRLTRAGLRLELPEAAPQAAIAAARAVIEAAGRPFAGAGPYRRGSAFLR